MCSFGENMMTETRSQEPNKPPPEPEAPAIPKRREESFRFGTEDPALTRRFAESFLARFDTHAGVILRKPLNPSRWRFWPYVLKMTDKGWGEIHVPGTVLMFQWHDRLRQLLALLRQPVLDPARLTGMLVTIRPWRGLEDCRTPSRWMRLGDWNGTEELLVYGPSDRRDIVAGTVAVLTPEDRVALMHLITDNLARFDTSS